MYAVAQLDDAKIIGTPDIYTNAVESTDPALQVFQGYFIAQKAQLPFGLIHGSFCPWLVLFKY
jgi:hypothetical protein